MIIFIMDNQNNTIFTIANFIIDLRIMDEYK